MKKINLPFKCKINKKDNRSYGGSTQCKRELNYDVYLYDGQSENYFEGKQGDYSKNYYKNNLTYLVFQYLNDS